MKKLLSGVGINDADYKVQIKETIGHKEDGTQIRKLIWVCPYYSRWSSMINRCYSVKLQLKQPTYKGCSVIPEWHYFMTFRGWMEKQDWEGKELDKDLLVKGNKVYGPETCVFLDPEVNMFLTERENNKGEYPTGVYFNKQIKRFIAKCSNVSAKKQEYLGTFEDIEEATKVYREFKYEQACVLASRQSDQRVVEALIGRYKFV